MAGEDTKSAENTVQAELQQYLTEKGVNSLFIKIVEQLLLDKPENPVEFIVQYLLKNFPEETAQFSRKSDNTDACEASVTPKAEESEEEKESDDEDDDEDEDDFDETKELPPMPAKTATRSRRVSVSAAVLNVDNLAKKEVIFPKTEEEAAKLKTILSATLLCSHLDDAAKNTLVAAMEKKEIADGVEIITQGDKVAEHYFVLEKGTAIVEKDGVQVLEYGEGSDFGELALMYNAPRAATVKSTSPCTLWQLDQASFKVIVMGAAIKMREKNLSFLSNVPMFNEMKDTERSTLADSLKPNTFQQGDEIVQQGDNGDEFYLIASGVVNVHVNGECIGDLNEGQYFGEIALLTAKPRQATIIAASENVQLLSVHRKAFQRVLGNMEDILKRNITSYTQYVAGVQM